jgi:protein-disulfide isomerase-like protein with CxxC motif
MNPALLIAIFNIVAPEVFTFINSQKQKVNPATGQPFTYAEVLENAGIALDVEHQKLLADMAADLAEGAK